MYQCKCIGAGVKIKFIITAQKNNTNFSIHPMDSRSRVFYKMPGQPIFKKLVEILAKLVIIFLDFFGKNSLKNPKISGVVS